MLFQSYRTVIAYFQNHIAISEICTTVYLIPFRHPLLTVLQKIVTTKLKSLNEMPTDTKISSVSEAVFYIFSTTKISQKHKQSTLR